MGNDEVGLFLLVIFLGPAIGAIFIAYFLHKRKKKNELSLFEN
jgi:hypothetical protein